ncbi:MAG: UvrD-helicase domain-containing protein [Campylobacterota bacterium]|nr:UvrD-helicase domain-containing protein [Campylobacterota bacterium]
MRQLQKQIEITKKQKQDIEVENNVIMKNIETIEDRISLGIEKNKDLNFEIDRYTQAIEHLPKTFKPTFLQMIIQLVSFGTKNYKREYVAHLKTLNNEKYKLIEQLSSTEKNINETKGKIEQKEVELKSNTQEIEQLKQDIAKLENEFDIKLELFKNRLTSFQIKIIQLVKNQYINDYTRKNLKDELKGIVTLKDEFLTHSKIKSFISEVVSFSKDDVAWIKNKNNTFVKNEMVSEKDFFATVESDPLTQKQQEAVLINENNNLVLAGAGSGKTSVVVAKVCYLIKKNILHPNEIIILAFNKNAQKELKERFEKKGITVKDKISKSSGVQIDTFHAYGLEIIAESMARRFDICPMSEAPKNMNKFIKDSIFKLLSSMGTFLKEFTQFIAYFSIPYKDESEFNSLGEYYDYQKDFDMKTLKHKVKVRSQSQEENLTTLQEETVKSYQELLIANFFTLNGIRYLYEEPYEIRTWTKEKRQYKPDFYLPDYGIYIEHFGIDRKGNTAPYIDKEKYLDGIEWKRELHNTNQTILVETYSYEFSEDRGLQLLKQKLLARNVHFREPTEAELHEILKEPIKNGKFTNLFTTFLSHFKSNRYTLDSIKEKSKEIERSSLFIRLFEFIFKEYQEFQKRNSCIDFDDMIVEALNNIEKGKYRHSFKHIFIDEFQDISTTRAMLIKSLLPLNNTSITAVGDDWQSINRFAGSNIKIIQDFEKTFGVSQTVALDYTFRFDNIVSSVASSFIQKNPNQLQKEIKTIKTQKQNKFSILLYWTTGNIKSELEEILNLIVKKEKDNEKSVMILARYNFLFKDIKSDKKELKISPYLKNKYPTLGMSLASVHGSKGNQADYVIVFGLDHGKFGFPSKIVDDPILDIVVPPGDDYEDAEERRLFYVALTRTKGTLFLLSNQYEKSSFIEELIQNYKDKIYFMNDAGAELTHCPECKTGILKKNTTNEDRRRHFYGCNNYPRCKYTENIHYCPQCSSEIKKDLEDKVAKCIDKECNFESKLCPKCNGHLIKRNGQHGEFLGCENYPTCSYSENIQMVRNDLNNNPF